VRCGSRASVACAAPENWTTALHVAMDSRQRECLWLLLKAGADGSARDPGRDGWHPMRLRRSLSCRSGPLSSTCFGSRARRCLGSRGSEAVATRVFCTAPPDHCHENAARVGCGSECAEYRWHRSLADAVRLLLAHGAKPNAGSSAGTQPIHDSALGDTASHHFRGGLGDRRRARPCPTRAVLCQKACAFERFRSRSARIGLRRLRMRQVENGVAMVFLAALMLVAVIFGH
jgi:hypothetical protein